MSQQVGKRIVITGAGGQLGQTLLRSALATTHTLIPLGRDALNIADVVNVKAVLDQHKPDCIINAAAYTAVDAAETNEDLAFAINGTGPENLALWAFANAAHLIHVSTDFVFGGTAHSPYRTDDPVGPISVYGCSKLAGEQRVTDILGGSASIVRTAWLYSSLNNNFVKTMLRLMAERDTLGIIDDQIGSPCSTQSLARCLAAIVDLKNPGGVYHWTDAGVASWYDFAVAIHSEALAAGILKQAITINPIPTEKYPTPAKRPAYSVLDKHATLSRTGCENRHWREELQAVLSEIARDQNS